MENTALAGELVETLGVLRRYTRRRVGRPWSHETLSPAQGELLRFIRRNPGTSVAAAAAELGVAPNTVSTLVSLLVAGGLLRREHDPFDRRVVRLHLTDSARREVERWRDERTAVVVEGLTQLDDAERRALEGALPVLARLAAALRPDERVGAAS